MGMLLLGIDIGTSSIKVAIVDAASSKTLVTVQYPDAETPINALQPGWAEQNPNSWWEHVQQAILKAHATKKYNPLDIQSIGIAYQMHGLVIVDKDQQVLRDSIIWCDSRAVEIGNRAFKNIGEEKCLSHLLNSPGNFTASKLAWVKENEPAIFEKIDKIMLPGDFIAMKLTGTITTSIAALSEGVFWDFKNKEISKDVLNYFGFDASIFPTIQEVFSNHGNLDKSIALSLGLKEGIPVAYKAGDQPNNALSLNVFSPGEVAATAGTSGVIYGVGDSLHYDKASRINQFAHVNYTKDLDRLGMLLCINGTGIMNSWAKKWIGDLNDYVQMNEAASAIAIGSEGLQVLPFGNGAERIFNNQIIGAHLLNLNLNQHSAAHIYRAVQEGIAFAFRYGLDIMKENGIIPKVIRAGNANLFKSNIFTEAFVNTLNVPVELYDVDGSVGAAKAGGMGAGVYTSSKEAFQHFTPIQTIEPTVSIQYDELYHHWLESLNKFI
jgi:xylulokinase